MKKLCGIVLIVIGLIMIYSLPEIIIALWPTEAKTLTMAEEFWMAGIVSLPIILAFGIGVALLLADKKPAKTS